MTNTYYNVEQLAEELSISPKTLARMRCDGTGPAFTKAGRRVLYMLANIEKWLSENTFNSTSEYQ